MLILTELSRWILFNLPVTCRFRRTASCYLGAAILDGILGTWVHLFLLTIFINHGPTIVFNLREGGVGKVLSENTNT